MRSRLVLLIALATGCGGGPMVFQGQSTLAVTGTAPPPVAAAPARVEVADNAIEIHEKIQFAVGKATIKHESFDLMNEIAVVIEKNPQIKKIRIEGYTSSEGDVHLNQKLSAKRAKAVMKYLTSHDIDASRLTAVGLGIEKPIADNSTEEGREQNRRVEFAIVDQNVADNSKGTK